MRFVALEKLINLHDEYTRQFRIDHLHLLLIQRDGERYLIEARCPHRGLALQSAHIENGIIRCTGHHYCFALADGRLLSATEEACRALKIFPLVYRDNELGFMLEDVA